MAYPSSQCIFYPWNWNHPVEDFLILWEKCEQIFKLCTDKCLHKTTHHLNPFKTYAFSTFVYIAKFLYAKEEIMYEFTH